MEDELLVIKRPKLLNSAFKCTICYQFVKPPIMACQNEHITCAECLARWKIDGSSLCGQCQQEINVPCRMLEQISESLEVGCEFNCGKRFALSEYRAHSDECDLGPVECAYGCTTMMAFEKFIGHMENEHGLYYLEPWTEGKFSCEGNNRFKERKFIASDVRETNFYLARYDERKFLLEEHLSDGGIRILVRLVGTSDDAAKYRSKISITASNVVNKKSFVTYVNPLRDPLRSVHKKGQYAEISADTLLKWTLDPQDLPHGYEITLKIRHLKNVI